MEPIIRFDHVTKRYRLGQTRVSLPTTISRALRARLTSSSRATTANQDLHALCDVSFEVGRGESLALVGQNGAGKTTILKLISGITYPTDGSLTTSGSVSALIELGAGFHPDLTGRENIYLNGAILGLSRVDVDRRFDEIVAFSELERFVDTPVKRYSSGMVVRLGFAVASCVQPDVLLVDEVLAVGDASFRMKCLQRIQSLLDEGTTLVFVSHNLYLVQSVCRSAIYLNHGSVSMYGPTRAVIDAYEHDLHVERSRKLNLRESGSSEGPAEVDIVRVEVRGSDGVDGERLRSDGPASVLVHYFAYQDLGIVSAAAHVTRSDGTTCCMMRTSTSGVQFEMRRGSGVICITFDHLQLITGEYYVEAHILNAEDSMGISSASSDWFSVTGSTLSYEERSGVFEPRVAWSHHQLADAYLSSNREKALGTRDSGQ